MSRNIGKGPTHKRNAETLLRTLLALAEEQLSWNETVLAQWHTSGCKLEVTGKQKTTDKVGRQREVEDGFRLKDLVELCHEACQQRIEDTHTLQKPPRAKKLDETGEVRNAINNLKRIGLAESQTTSNGYWHLSIQLKHQTSNTDENIQIFSQAWAECQELGNPETRSFSKAAQSLSQNQALSTQIEKLHKASEDSCIKKFQLLTRLREQAKELAKDRSIGKAPSSLSIKTGSIQILRGEMGIGKSLVSLRIFQDLIDELARSTDAPIPIYLESTTSLQESSLEEEINSFLQRYFDASHIQKSKRQRLVLVDGVDQLGETKAKKLVLKLEELIYQDNSKYHSCIITSRPLRFFNDRQDWKKIEAERLNENEAIKLLQRNSNSLNAAVDYSQWQPSLREAALLPLFNLIIGKLLSSEASELPNSTGELLEWLVEDALKESGYQRNSQQECLLRQAAVEAIESGKSIIPKAVFSSGDSTALQHLLDSRLIIEKDRRSIYFPIQALLEYFAAKALQTALMSESNQIDPLKAIERWRYPISLLAIQSPARLLEPLLISIAQKHPVIAAQIIIDSSSSHIQENPVLFDYKEVGRQLRAAFEAWMSGFGSLSALLVPVNDSGKLVSLGFEITQYGIEYAWYKGDNDAEEVLSLPENLGFFDDDSSWSSRGFSKISHGNTWVWRWSLHYMLSGLSNLWESPTFLAPGNSTLMNEAAWRAAKALIQWKESTTWKNRQWPYYISSIPLDEIQPILKYLEDEWKLRRIHTIQGISIGYSGSQEFYLSTLRKVILHAQEEGKTQLKNPWPGPDRRVDIQKLQLYSSNQIQKRVQAVFSKAVDSYQQLISKHFAKFVPHLRYGQSLTQSSTIALHPFSINSDEGELKQFHCIWYSEPDGSDYTQLRTEIIECHEEWISRRDSGHWLMAINITPYSNTALRDDAVTCLVYDWLKKDFQELFSGNALDLFSSLQVTCGSHWPEL